MNTSSPLRKGTIYIISDGSGETASALTRAALIHYRDHDINIVRSKNVRTEDQFEALIDEVFEKRGLIVHTVASPQMRLKIKELAANKGVPCVDLLGPILNEMDSYFGTEDEDHKAGLLRQVDDKYFKRIEAIEYTVKHDDGKTLADLESADIILVGISRTSKTPLSIFLSHKGWKVANVPLVYNSPLPEELFKVDQRKIVGLIIDSDSLIRIRRKRLEKFGQDPGGEYASLGHIQKEIDYAMDLFKKNKRWPVFNVTDRALEETASEIIKIVATRMNLDFDALL
ncbi:MAG: kinase/pyrophosphorylase [Bdellovibrionales bacterium]|nr:kinase/pyrophosphorylase [Bdellovibrionales bacterium]